MRQVIFSATFKSTVERAAESRAVRFLENAGFSVGRKQAHSPTGIMHGDFDIQKWRNLNTNDRDVLHGAMVTDVNQLKTSFEIYDTLTGSALSSFHDFLDAHFLANGEMFFRSQVNQTAKANIVASKLSAG